MNELINWDFDDIPPNEVVPWVEDGRDRILSLESAIIALEEEHEAQEPQHYFAPGMYGRELLIKAGELIVGKIHKHAHINVISQGEILVVTEFGRARYEAPFTFVSEPLTKRAVLALEDTIWTTIHATDSTDLEVIEEEVIAESYNMIEGDV